MSAYMAAISKYSKDHILSNAIRGATSTRTEPGVDRHSLYPLLISPNRIMPASFPSRMPFSSLPGIPSHDVLFSLQHQSTTMASRSYCNPSAEVSMWSSFSIHKMDAVFIKTILPIWFFIAANSAISTASCRSSVRCSFSRNLSCHGSFHLKQCYIPSPLRSRNTKNIHCFIRCRHFPGKCDLQQLHQFSRLVLWLLLMPFPRKPS